MINNNPKASLTTFYNSAISSKDGLYLKIDREFGRLPRLTFERKLEPVLIQNLLHQRQPDPLPVFFSAEKRCEQIGAHRRRNAAARVFDHHETPPGLFSQSNCDRARAINRFNRIFEHVHEDLLHLASIQSNRFEFRLRVPDDLDPQPDAFSLKEEGAVFDQASQVTRLQVWRRQAEDVGEIAHERVEPIGAFEDHVERRLEILAILAAQSIGIMQARMEQ